MIEQLRRLFSAATLREKVSYQTLEKMLSYIFNREAVFKGKVDFTGADVTGIGSSSWDGIKDKPTLFPPSPHTHEAADLDLSSKQDVLVSGTNIKTINSTSLLGSGDLVITGDVDSVNGQTGVVVLDADDIDDTATTNKFVTSTDITNLSNLSGINSGDQDLSGLLPNTHLTDFTHADIAHSNRAALDLVSGTNTGDQNLSGLVPYTGATTNVALGANTISTTSRVITPKISPASDSTTAFQVTKADGSTSVVNVDTTNGRVGIGITPTAKLHIIAPTNTEDGTRVLTINRPNGGEIAYITDQARFVTANGPGFYPCDGNGGILRAAAALFVGVNSVSATSNSNLAYVILGRPLAQSINTAVAGATTKIVDIIGTINPTSQNTIFKSLDIRPTLNQTGTASGAIIGLDYNPTTTSVLGNHYAALFRSGNVGIGTTSPTLAKLEVNGATLSQVKVEANTAGSGSPNVITAAESRSVFTNEGATALNYHTLPTAAAGLVYTFYVQDTDGIRVVANTGDTIRINTAVSAAAGYAESTTVGSSVTLAAINATEWVATSVIGTWALT